MLGEQNPSIWILQYKPNREQKAIIFILQPVRGTSNGATLEHQKLHSLGQDQNICNNVAGAVLRPLPFNLAPSSGKIFFMSNTYV